VSEKKYVIYFGDDQDILKKVADVFVDYQAMSFNDMKSTFDFLQSSHVEALVFETYQKTPSKGISHSDLDVLLYFATSETSKNRMIKFYPLESLPQTDDSQSAEVLYEDLYDKYLFLMQGQAAAELTPAGTELPAGLELLADLIGTLDEACEDLDENLHSSTKVPFSESTETQVVKGTALTNDAHQRVSGGVKDIGEEDQLIEGNREDLAEDTLKVTGADADNDSSTLVRAYGEEEEEHSQQVSGDREDLSNGSTLVEGSREDLSDDSVKVSISGTEDNSSTLVKGHNEEEDELSQRINGDREDLSEGSTLVGGTREDLTEDSTMIKGNKQTEAKEEAYTIKSEEKDQEDKNSKTVIKGKKEDLKTEFMTVKSLKGEAQEEDEDHTGGENLGINQRNSLGQTPIMLFSKIGDVEKAQDLAEKGADLSLRCKEGKSILHYACRNSENIHLVKFLIEQQDCKTNKRDSQGREPLYEAVMSNSPEIVKFLLEKGARMSAKIDGKTYLHIAAQMNKIQSFKVLLSFGANSEAKDEKGLTVSQYCKTKKKINFLKVMEAIRRLKEKKAS